MSTDTINSKTTLESVALQNRGHRKSSYEQFIIGIVVFVPMAALLISPLWIEHYGIKMHDVVLTLVTFFVTSFGIEIGFHRLFAHGAFKTSSFVRSMLAVLGCMAGQGPVIYWVSHHRQHHAFTDQEGDPHSPRPSLASPNRLGALVHAHLGWVFTAEKASPGKWTRDLLNDRAIIRIDRHYLYWLAIGVLMPATAVGLYFCSLSDFLSSLLLAGLVRVCLVQQTAYLVNSLCHTIGSSPFVTGDDSRNNILLILPTWGGAWHNNHHAFPASASNSTKWWQFDPGYWTIAAMVKLGVFSAPNRTSATAITRKQRRLRSGLPAS
jgi:stearoyl-CoA desaturase (delta-9 desaturase)